MGKRIFVAILVCFLAGLGSLAMSARAQEKPQLWTVWEFTVKPPKDEAFYQAFKGMVALMAKHKFSYSMYAHSVNQFRYELATPLKNYADLENLYKAWDDLAKKAGDEWKNLWKAFEGAYECMDQSNWYWRPDLSYAPTSPRLKPEEEKFLLEDVFYVEPGKEADFEAVSKDLMALCKNKNITEQAIQVFVCDIGPGMPVYEGSGAGKDMIDFWDNNRKMWDKLGKDGEALVAKCLTLIRKREWRQGWFLPELSYIVPKEKK
jgi:hypothetical protein